MNTHEATVIWMDPSRPVDEQAAQPCFGLGCLLRGACQCYRAVEWVPGGSTSRASCLRDGEYPSYLAAAVDESVHIA